MHQPSYPAKYINSSEAFKNWGKIAWKTQWFYETQMQTNWSIVWLYNQDNFYVYFVEEMYPEPGPHIS